MLLAWSKFFPSALQHLPEEEGQGKGLQAEILVVWQQSGSAAVLLASPCCQNIHTLLFAPPRTILPSPSKQGGRQDFRRQDRCSAGPGDHTAHMAEGHSLLLLLHILAEIPCPEQWATK